MKETESIDEFAGKISCLVSKFSGLGAVLEDNVLVLAQAPNALYSNSVIGYVLIL